MTNSTCKVFETVNNLTYLIDSGRLIRPRLQQRAKDLLKLLKDISLGTGGPAHLPAIFKSLAEIRIEHGSDEACMAFIQIVGGALDAHKEVFVSHIETHNCPTGDCAKLAPAPCQTSCPAGIDVPGYITLIGQGRDAEAIELIRKDNPFPWVCGLVCTHPCEFMCVRARIDTPIAIRDLKAFAAERAMSEGGYKNLEKGPDNENKVCIIGAGPAGLTAAYYLVLNGYKVTVIEALPYGGGMLMVGIPRYRLPREVIDREVAMIEELGVDFRYNTRLGVDITLEQLKKEEFDAFFIAIGAHNFFKMGIPGEEDFPQVIDAITFLRRIAMGDRHMPGKRAAIIGGGNVAIDSARTALRLGSEEVTIVYRRTRVEMPASEEEIYQAEEEGINFSFLTIPIEVHGSDGMVNGLRCTRTELGPEDESGRRRPIPVKGSDYMMDVDTVISAIGQAINPIGLTSLDDLQWSRRKTIVVHGPNMETTSPGVFAGGDVVLGPATVVEAIGAGKKAADAIDRYCRGIPQPTLPPVPVRRQRLDCQEVPAPTKMALHRPEMPLLGTERRRITFQQVELGYTENMAREEARRCLRCDICIRCGTCVEICRDKMKINALQLGYFDFDHPVETDFRVTAEKCILCGACATNCPTGAMKMEDRGDERVLMLSGTILNRLKLEYCQLCGAVLGPARYHDYITKRIDDISQRIGDKRLCVECARKALAQQHAEIAPPAVRE
ncbi:MAG: FAD-dependent oxidoreductase [Nanoarchaeota archaeon]|nr:FAD-dependent oxidoreductase [Nanoarchaeota archaeon]